LNLSIYFSHAEAYFSHLPQLHALFRLAVPAAIAFAVTIQRHDVPLWLLKPLVDKY
jgi:hypothetical protein